MCDSPRMKMRAHLFICTNSPDKAGKCGHKNSEQMRKRLKEKFSQEYKSKDLRINSSGCLGQCEHGIAAVLYPQGEWFLDLTDQDDQKLYEAVSKSLEK